MVYKTLYRNIKIEQPEAPGTLKTRKHLSFYKLRQFHQQIFHLLSGTDSYYVNTFFYEIFKKCFKWWLFCKLIFSTMYMVQTDEHLSLVSMFYVHSFSCWLKTYETLHLIMNVAFYFVFYISTLKILDLIFPGMSSDY